MNPRSTIGSLPNLAVLELSNPNKRPPGKLIEIIEL